jgi:hypothetical protein
MSHVRLCGKAIGRRLVPGQGPIGLLLLCTAVLCLSLVPLLYAEEVAQKAFASPEEALKELVQAAAMNNTNDLLAIFGPDGKDMVVTGSESEDREDRARFVSAAIQLKRVVYEGETKAMLHFGKGDWSLPIPLVKRGTTWVFDTAAGKDEIINRRIGKNEMSAIAVCKEYLKAQQEYADTDHDNDGVLEYAQKIFSTPGRQNGLYWEAKEGAETSPFGPLIAGAARAEMTGGRNDGKTVVPYHGYYYKILKRQGKSAAGGAYHYVIHGNMVAGFALIAYPADYGISGIMTFVVNQNGIVYEKDLGRDTERTANATRVFDPDKTWKRSDQ